MMTSFQGDLEDSLAIMSKSLKYESIVNLPQPPLIIPMVSLQYFIEKAF